MKRKGNFTGRQLLAGASAAVLAALLWPCPVHASCGDYVHFRSQGNGSPSTESKPPASKPCQHCPQSPGGKPCQGPNCERSNAPAPTPPSTLGDGVSELAYLEAAATPSTSGPITLREPDSSRVPNHYHSRIYHPPRAY